MAAIPVLDRQLHARRLRPVAGDVSARAVDAGGPAPDQFRPVAGDAAVYLGHRHPDRHLHRHAQEQPGRSRRDLRGLHRPVDSELLPGPGPDGVRSVCARPAGGAPVLRGIRGCGMGPRQVVGPGKEPVDPDHRHRHRRHRRHHSHHARQSAGGAGAAARDHRTLQGHGRTGGDQAAQRPHRVQPVHQRPRPVAAGHAVGRDDHLDRAEPAHRRTAAVQGSPAGGRVSGREHFAVLRDFPAVGQPRRRYRAGMARPAYPL